MSVNERNLSWEISHVAPEARAEAYGHKGGVLWFTGLSGSGKSTLANALEKALFDAGWKVFVLDGDNVRQGLSADLGFSARDRAENIRRIAHVAALFAQSGMLVLTAFISPYRADRRAARDAAGNGFSEIHAAADLETCEARDVKGLYARARAGEIPEFTGVGAPYELPANPDLVIDTGVERLDVSVERLIAYCQETYTA